MTIDPYSERVEQFAQCFDEGEHKVFEQYSGELWKHVKYGQVEALAKMFNEWVSWTSFGDGRLRARFILQATHTLGAVLADHYKE